MMSVASIFHAAQQSCSKHRKCTEALHALRTAAADKASFDDEVFTCIACVLPVYKRERAAECVIEFVVQFATKHGGEDSFDEEFVERVTERLLRLAAAKDKAVRFRVVQLIGQMFERMGEDVEVSDALFERVEEVMLERCRDKVPLVRAWAIKALSRLQDPSNTADVVTAELLRLMNDDPAKEVRMAALMTAAPSRQAIKATLARVRDVSPEVRKHALQVRDVGSNTMGRLDTVALAGPLTLAPRIHARCLPTRSRCAG